MSDVPDDPFRAEDPRAAEREARRREREEHRKARSSGARRSLGERVSGALGAVTGSGGGQRGAKPPAAAQGRSAPPTASQPGATTQPPASQPGATTQPPASQTPPTSVQPQAPAQPTSPAAGDQAGGTAPAEPAAGAPPAAAAAGTGAAAGEGDDWLSDTGSWNPDTSEWLTETGDRPAVTGESGAVTGEQGSITGESGAITGEHGPITGEHGPITGESGVITGDHAPITGDRPAVAGGAGGGPGSRVGTPLVGAGGPRDPRTLWIRRLIALGVFLVALGAMVLLAKATLGGSNEPAPVAKGPKTLKTEDVVIPEGLTIAQIADVAKQAGLKGDYEQAVDKAAKKFPLKKYDASDAASMEGFLFPATYEVEKDAPVSDLVAKQLEAFRQYFDPINLKYAEKKNLTPYDILKIASMIEKEVQVDKERPLVAAVIYNRLSAGDTLGIDATLRYGLEKYDGQLLESELESDNPYNTRVIAGLPPTPIANPGVASMEAAANPAKTDDYYFVVKPGTCGEHFFTDSSAEFDQAAADYQAALQAEGGSPTDC